MGSGSIETPATEILVGRSRRTPCATDCSSAAARPQRRSSASASSSMRLSQAGVVAVSLAELTLEGQPAGGLGMGGRGLDEDRLARSAKAGDGPVRVERMGVGDERVELGERLLPPREIRGQDAVAGPEWVRRLLVAPRKTPEVRSAGLAPGRSLCTK
jgi:hypothetical protein